MKRKLLSTIIITSFVVTACTNQPVSQTEPVPPTPSAPSQAETILPTPEINPTYTLSPTVESSSTPAEPTSSNDIEIQAEGVSFVIPEGLAGGAPHVTVSAEGGTDQPYWGVHPDFSRFELDGYVLGERFHAPRIEIYPIEEFRQVSEYAATTIDALQGILESGDLSAPEHFPFLPIFNASQVIKVKAEFLNFQNGSGLRFLTQYDQAPIPINNDELFYTYQGITDDGRYYVSFVMPVSLPLLPENGEIDAQTPEGGYPPPSFDAPDFAEQFDTYRQNVTAAIQAAEDNTFIPSLDDLDALVQSLKIE